MTTTGPVTLAPDADPIQALRAMAKFLPGEDHGLAEIRGGITLGLAALIGNRNLDAPLPLFDARTRVVAVLDLATWLRDRGFEASVCRWERQKSSDFGDRSLKWILTTGPSRVPTLPPEPHHFAGLEALTPSQRVALLQRYSNARDAFDVRPKEK